MRTIKDYFFATRPWSFTMTVNSVVLGSILAVSEPGFNLIHLLFTVIGMVCVHGATNLLNDYYDEKYGADTPEAPGCRYRPHPVLTKLFTRRHLLVYSMVLYACSLGLGVYFIFIRGWPIIVLMALGGFCSIFYTAGPIRYKARALGEAAVFFLWGPLMVGGSYIIQSPDLRSLFKVVVISVIQGLWVLLVIYANNLKDLDFDKDKSIHTVANLLGKRKALILYVSFCALIFLLLGVEIALGYLHLVSLAALLTLPLVIKLILPLFRDKTIPVDFDPKTAQAGMFFGFLLNASIIVQFFLFSQAIMNGS
ncbi:MAG: prenyltransferase [Spirochaetales bacterium]|nr:prenyltransferase [Spirochaetales bacterium]